MKKFFFALTRVSIGWIFLWAFLDKAFGFGFTTEREDAWLEGGSPTAGFLEEASKGPFTEFFSGLSGEPWVDWVFMAGLLLIGIGLVLGIALRLSAFFGAVMMLLIYAAAFIQPAANPFMDEHLVYAFILLAFMNSNVDEKLGFGKSWKRLEFVKNMAILK